MWLAQQITEAFPWDSAPKFLIRDNDVKFGGVFKRRVRAMGIRDRPTSFRSPWQNGHTERVIGTIRRECLDHVIVVNDTHLRRVLSAYVQYYNDARTHRSLDKDSPLSLPKTSSGRIRTKL
jgi:transposase InsO family protein